VRGRLFKNASLAEYTSWRVGGPAESLYVPSDLNDLGGFLQQLPEDEPLLWLGLGSNVLIRDGGVPGAVVVTQGALHTISQLDAFTIRAEAGVACAKLARHTARLGLTGLEFMAGIPGTVGGALAMNAGCWGGETWQTVVQVETMNRAGLRQWRPASEYQTGYRHVSGPKDEWFVAGHFKLVPGEKACSLAVIHELLEKRSASQPTGLPNCGSVFRNPTPEFAARLIEQCGLKGERIGDAIVSEKHANFIINQGNATASDIEALIAKIIDNVFDRHGVRLMTEVCIIGR
jgi:UDP-N-acetylmuramate dehydrogenase